MTYTCKICGNTESNHLFLVKEMMLGLRDEFEYFQCGNCQCLQIGQIPEDMNRYYPDDYYSFQFPDYSECNLRDRRIKRRMKRRMHHYVGGPIWFTEAQLKLKTRILDIGCGSGFILFKLFCEGFNDLTGIDPYIPREFSFKNCVNLLRKSVFDLNGTFDFIMLHHSFEHMEEPLKVLKVLRERLRSKGRILIRIPVVPSLAWSSYGVNWAQLDAPRHFFIHSPQSLHYLTEGAGFQIEKVFFDSTDFQFWGSEQYLKDIPLHDPRSFLKGLKQSIFSEQDILRYRAQANQLNAAGQGDQIGIFLRTLP